MITTVIQRPELGARSSANVKGAYSFTCLPALTVALHGLGNRSFS